MIAFSSLYKLLIHNLWRSLARLLLPLGKNVELSSHDDFLGLSSVDVPSQCHWKSSLPWAVSTSHIGPTFWVRFRIARACLPPSTHGVTVMWFPFVTAVSGNLSAEFAGSLGARLLSYGMDNLSVKLQLGLLSCFLPPIMAIAYSRSRDACFRYIPRIPGNTLPSVDVHSASWWSS